MAQDKRHSYVMTFFVQPAVGEQDFYLLATNDVPADKIDIFQFISVFLGGRVRDGFVILLCLFRLFDLRGKLRLFAATKRTEETTQRTLETPSQDKSTTSKVLPIASLATLNCAVEKRLQPCRNKGRKNKLVSVIAAASNQLLSWIFKRSNERYSNLAHVWLVSIR